MALNIPARYTVPESIPHELARENVNLLLDQEMKMTVLVAPSGYGKSVVAAQWARRQPNVIWVRLTQEDRDAQFFVQALAEGISTFGITLSNWNEQILREVSVSRVVNDLLSDVNLWPDDLTFILDGGEYLSADSASVLANFTDGLNGHRVILLQHDGSPFEIAPYVIRGVGHEINMQHLAFTAGEAATLAQTFEVQGADSVALQADLAGWPAGVMLSLYAHARQLSLTPDNLIRTLIQRLDASIQADLPALSVIEMWSAGTPTALHLNLPSNWLAELQRVGLPMTKHGRDFAPHDVLRAYLQQELTHTPEREKQMHQYAGALAERQGEPYTAVKHFLAADDVKAGLKVAEDLLPGWYRTANWKVARDVLSQFPDQSLTDELRSILALSYGETNETEKAIELALRQLEIKETTTAYYTLALKCYRTNEVDKGLEYTERGLEVADSQRDVIQMLRTKAAFRMKQGRTDEALEFAKEAVTRAVVYGDNALRLSAQSVYAFAYGRANRTNQESLYVSEQLYLLARDTESPHRLMPIIQTYSVNLSRANREREGLTLLENFIKSYGEAYPLCNQLLITDLANLNRQIGNLERSLELAKIGASENQKAGYHNFVDTCYSIIVWHYVGSNNTEMARVTASEFLRYMEFHKYQVTPRFGALVLHYYAIGDMERAKHELVIAAKQDLELHKKPEPLVILLRILIESDSGESSLETIIKFCKALEYFPEDYGLLKAGWTRLKPIFYAHAEANPNNVLLRTTISGVEKSEDKSLYSVSIKTLGKNTLTIQDTDSRLSYGTALEALVFHLLYPQSPQDEIALAIWGKGDLYKARGSAQKARGTLNKLLREGTGNNTIEMLQTSGPGRRNLEWYVNPDVHVNIDAIKVLKSQDADEIFSLHQGPFLSGINHDWVIEERININKHISEVYQRRAESEGDNREGLKWLMRAAVIDQEVLTFEKALQLSISIGDNDIRRSAEAALAALARGNEVEPSGWVN